MAIQQMVAVVEVKEDHIMEEDLVVQEEAQLMVVVTVMPEEEQELEVIVDQEVTVATACHNVHATGLAMAQEVLAEEFMAHFHQGVVEE